MAKDPNGHFKATKAEIEAFTLRVGKIARRELGRVIRRIEKGDYQSAAEVAQWLGSLESQLEKAGLMKELDSLRAVYARQITFIREQLQGAGAREVFSDIDAKIIEKLISFDVQNVASTLAKYTDDVRSTLMKSVLSGDTSASWDTFEAKTDGMEGRVETEVNTMVSGFARSVTTEKAQELGFDLMEYIGPDDDVTRDFCEHVLSGDPGFGIEAREAPIYTLEEIKSMDNGQNLDVLTYAGGYNCRHQWRPVTQEQAAQEGYGENPDSQD